jgi:HK97 family phage prohead protease
MKHAAYEITEFKALTDGPKGLFAAMVSVFGNVDKHNDRMIPGAFTKSLAKWKESGAPVPVIWSHEHKDPASYIGDVQPGDITETEKGLVVAGKLDIESNPMAAQVFELLRTGRVKEWSFGYEIMSDRIADDTAHELLEVDLVEVGPTLKGANPEVRTLALKELEEAHMSTIEAEASGEPETKLDAIAVAALADFDQRAAELTHLIDEKIGRVISSKTESKIRSALQALEAILAGLDQDAVAEASSSPEAKAQPVAPGEEELRRRDHERIGLYLAERGR